ncbi:hypothetical protein C8C77_11848 [Halanaerobium saccharolyticum]|uniref:DUF5723 domain-containing protein n=1 Tax=Halanaerobium saccharolyticum TaxID=43595 RepID=A0A4R7YVM8_9FIRM|nr:hypothetical protein [Halanaerobium saccharolyticum]RAK07097.1 hypothetical protein C7958_11712 [Halanaerobium saccharolyticum]TDW01891.1 hypothetical protein C8C77_11848 [Halanaerobium saccharolyticum]TDX53137.1 hypothetical protein C7956_11848 [Halanaerobium saccharolyticum]
MKRSLLFLLTITIIFSTALTASAALDAEAIGMGDNFSTMTGEAAYYSNPAGMALRENNFALKANFGFSVWNNVFENSEFTEDEIESKLTGEDLILAGRSAFGTQFYYKNFALAVNGRAEGMLETDSDAAEILTGDTPEISLDALRDKGLIRVKFEESGGGAAATADVSLSYAREIFNNWSNNSKNIDSVYFGATYHYLEGEIYKFAGNGEINAEAIIDNSNPNNSYVKYDGSAEFFANRTEDGEASGNAFDFGLSMKTEDDYTFAFSAMNIGELSADQYYKDGAKYEAKDSDSDGNNDYLEETTYKGALQNKKITYKLPRVYRLGIKKEFSQNTVLYADYSRVSYDGGQDDNIYAIGSEFRKTKFIPLRLGLNYSSLREDVELAAGMGINISDNFKINVGISDLMALSDSAKGLKFGISTFIGF